MCREFLKFCGVHKRKLDEVFGKDAYSKLQEECGDSPNKLLMEGTPLAKILEQYGQLVRKSNGLPVIAEWVQANFKPTPDGLSKVHNIKWSEMPSTFIKEYINKPDWKDAIEILKKNVIPSTTGNSNKTFFEIVDKLVIWTPDRKRIIEEGIKLRSEIT